MTGFNWGELIFLWEYILLCQIIKPVTVFLKDYNIIYILLFCLFVYFEGNNCYNNLRKEIIKNNKKEVVTICQ